MVHRTHDFHSDYRIIGKLVGANMNVDTDQEIPITAQAGNYTVTDIVVTNASISLTTAVGGVYTAAAKSGAIVANSQVYSALTAATKWKALTLTGTALTDVYDAATQDSLFLSLTTPQGAAATADVYVFGKLLPG